MVECCWGLLQALLLSNNASFTSQPWTGSRTDIYLSLLGLLKANSRCQSRNDFLLRVIWDKAPRNHPVDPWKLENCPDSSLSSAPAEQINVVCKVFNNLAPNSGFFASQALTYLLIQPCRIILCPFPTLCLCSCCRMLSGIDFPCFSVWKTSIHSSRHTTWHLLHEFSWHVHCLLRSHSVLSSTVALLILSYNLFCGAKSLKPNCLHSNH